MFSIRALWWKDSERNRLGAIFYRRIANIIFGSGERKMKKKIGLLTIMLVALVCVFALAACVDSGEDTQSGIDIRVTVTQSGNTEGISQFTVQTVDENGAYLSQGENKVVGKESSIRLIVKCELKPHFSGKLFINENETDDWSQDADGTERATVRMLASKDTVIKLQVEEISKKTVTIIDNTDGRANFNVCYQGQPVEDTFRMYAGESFEYTLLKTTTYLHRFITTVTSKHYGTVTSDSNGLSNVEDWREWRVYEEDDQITVQVDIDYGVEIDIEEINPTNRPNLKVIAVNPQDVPAGITDPEEILGYGSVIMENKPSAITTHYVFLPKDSIFAIVYEDEAGNRLFLRCMIDDAPSSPGLHAVAYGMKVKALGY